jgi:hypothetical protein
VNEQEQDLATRIYQAIQDASNNSARSQQAKQFVLGVSDIGYCPERTRRHLDNQVPEDTDVLAAWIGTALGDHAEQALKVAWPEAIIQGEVHLNLRVQGRSFSLPGHPDVIIPGWGILDAKTDYGLGTVEREGSSFAQQWQRNAYALAAFEGGLLGDMNLEDVQVGNFWIDRAGIDKRVHVEVTAFDQAVIDQGVEEIDSVIYAYLNDEEAEKRPPRQVCAVTCGFFSKCREWETDVHGLIEDVELVSHIEAYAAGGDLERRGKRMKDEAKEHLREISGSTGRHSLRWTWINESPVPGHTRKGYYKIDLRAVKGADG